MARAKTDKYLTIKHFLLCSDVTIYTSSSKGNESWASTKSWNIFFHIKMHWGQSLKSSEADKYWSMAVFQGFLNM